jgi:gamma-glutamyl-gamma-aminobutyrate hydrolase PuuD
VSRPPVIGVCGRSAHGRGLRPNDPIDWQYRANLDAVMRAGGAPLIIPTGMSAALLDALLERVDGLLLCGGADIDPGRYGAGAIAGIASVTDPAADVTDMLAARAARDRDLPTLGICRGAQMIAVASGGSLWQDIPMQFPGALTHRDSPSAAMHPVALTSGSQLHELIGPITQVNSRHHQAIRDPGRDMEIVARAPDGIVEAIESHHHRFLLGVQWHPEELGDGFGSEELFTGLVRAASGAQLPIHA